MRLEELYDDTIEGYYEFDIQDNTIDIHPMITKILQDDKKVAISKFFNTLVEMIDRVYTPYKELPLVVSGGVFQNAVLLKLVRDRFENVYMASSIPPNDGGIALGQIFGSVYLSKSG
jgi:hydrogenase maturation protein HypF